MASHTLPTSSDNLTILFFDGLMREETQCCFLSTLDTQKGGGWSISGVDLQKSSSCIGFEQQQYVGSTRMDEAEDTIKN